MALTRDDHGMTNDQLLRWLGSADAVHRCDKRCHGRADGEAGCGQDGAIAPWQSDIAAAFNVTTRTVSRRLRELIDAGAITITRTGRVNVITPDPEL